MLSLGLDGWAYLSTASRADQALLDHLLERAYELRENHDQNLAAAIVNTLGKALK